MGVSLLWMLVHATAQADEAIDQPPHPPDIAFLEFLGGWETEDHEWVAPMLFEDASETDRLKSNGGKNPKKASSTVPMEKEGATEDAFTEDHFIKGEGFDE